MKTIRLLLLPALLLFCSGLAAQTSATRYSEPRLYITGSEQTSQHVAIEYDITYVGFIELHLFDPDGEKIWIKGQVTDHIGKDKLRIPKKPLEPGKRYSYILKYKGKDYKGSFYSD